MSWIVIAIEMLNGLGIGLGLGFGMFAPFGDGAFVGGVCPQVPLHLRRGGHLGLFKVWPLRGRLTSNDLLGRLTSNDLRGRLTSNDLRGRLTSNDLLGRLTSNNLRERLAYSCPALCQTWLKGYAK
jgi:hypothetical protein